ncbi:hypothetical protein LJC68_06880 [Bacteroidales bacterium OttesenSCG-928-B11]|nr:hypothetical protein [Bacteroidales bacterium OttesenSCG-928-E04]MDL2308201.1 hypothetical protein [Bacteroidales bacterium OttesenSCG-928-C03]MDL2312585.1 hypothetical protein [Bacteroidales bacterium OttesenSCG-928-B11]MDL2325639.1 hypothetical protein [Bacteroidales bacterium OttesenSCG-928-A14]
MKRIPLLILLAIIVLSFPSCDRPPAYSIIPEIVSYDGFEYYIDERFNSPKGKLSFTFTDGDGDVGLSESDTLPPFNRGSEHHYNFILSYYEKQNGEFVLIEPPQTMNTRIPVLSNAVPESIEVRFSIDLDLNPLSVYDTIKLEFFIYDRKLHKSNVMTTPELILPRNS